MVNGRVVVHYSSLIIRNAEFRVRPGGQRRVRETGKKAVHAFVVGEILNPDLYGAGELPTSAPVAVTYNPYQFDTFVTREGHAPVHCADYVELTGDGKCKAYGVYLQPVLS